VRPLFAAALEEVFGATGDLDAYDFSGKTDPRIVVDLLSGAGLPAARIAAGLRRVRDVYLARLGAELAREGMCLLPGVGELLAELAARQDLALGLLTGNWEEGARIKLSRFDLNRYFPFGAFGDDRLDRRDLPPVALERASLATGRAFCSTDTLIVGDSLLDVACGRAHGIPVLAVATGRTPARALEEAGADWVIPDLEAVPAALFGSRPLARARR
jgi:phosphoglycolate phosphatase-like HAD superfamily hydrolase